MKRNEGPKEKKQPERNGRTQDLACHESRELQEEWHGAIVLQVTERQSSIYESMSIDPRSHG